MEFAEKFPVGIYIREEIAARGWSERTTARRCNMTEDMLSEVLNGTKVITPSLAECLGEGFGVSPQLFLNLQRSA